MMLDAPLAPAVEGNREDPATAEVRLKIIDGDVHPALRALSDLKPYLSAHWWQHLQTYGSRKRSGMQIEPYPKSAPRACRRAIARCTLPPLAAFSSANSGPPD